MKNQKWVDEFSEFAQAEPQSVPEDLNLKLQEKMAPLLNPSGITVFGKVFGIHLGVGLISLAVCHQFELNPFRTSFSLDDWFMKVGGHSFCMIACGFFFVALTFLAANFVLTIEELKALKRNGFLQTFTIGLSSLALFYFFGAELVLSMAGLWLLGALLAGLLATEMTWKLRTV